MPNTHQHDDKVFSALLNFLYPEAENIQEEIRLLEEFGHSYDDLSQEGISYVKKLEKEYLTQLSRDNRKRMLSVLSQIREKIESGTNIAERLKAALSSEDPDLQLAFHKLDNISDDEWKSVLADIEALRKLKEGIQRVGPEDDEEHS